MHFHCNFTAHICSVDIIWFHAFQLFVANCELLPDLRQIHNHGKKYFQIVQFSIENDSLSPGAQVCLL